MKLLLSLILVFLGFTGITSAQTVNDTILASQYYKKADSLCFSDKSDESIKLFNEALPIYKKAEAWERVAGCYNRIAENCNDKTDYKKAFSYAKKALNISISNLPKENIQKANALTNIGLYYELGVLDYKKALDYYKKALDIRIKILPENHLDIAKNYNFLGIVSSYSDQYNEALYYYKKSLEIRLKVFGENHEKTGIAYNNIARIYDDQGYHKKALKYYKKDLEICLNILGEKDNSTAYSYSNIGGVYLDNLEPDKALQYYKKALQIFKLNNNSLGILGSYNNIGSVYKTKGYYDEALIYFEKALTIIANSAKQNKRYEGGIIFNIGSVNFNLKKYKKALEYQKKAILINIDLYGEDSPRTAELYLNIGETYEKIKDYTRALEKYQKTLEISLKNNINPAANYNAIGNLFNKQKEYQKAMDYYKKAIQSNTKNGKSIDSNILLNTLEGQSKVSRKIYQQGNSINDLKKSVEKYQKIDTLISSIRKSLASYKDKVNFSDKTKKIYTNFIETQLLLFNHTKIQDELHRAFLYVEKSKSNTLKGLLNNSNAKSFSGLSMGLIELEKELRVNKAFYRSKVNEELSSKQIDSVKLTNYESKLFDISRRQDSLTEVLENNYPKYHQLKYNNEIISVTDIQKKLNRNQTLLEFFVADSITYAFTISKNELNVKELPTPKLTEKIEQLREGITNKNTKTYKTAAYQLYQQLLVPIKDQMVGKELIIVPDGPLWHLNFDLLLTQEDDSNDPKELSYLLKDYAITYANSATLLFNSFKNDKPIEKQQECLAFSFTDSTNIIESKTMDLAVLRGTDDDLPGTREEIKAIADIIDGQYFYGSEANEKNFKKNAPQYNILHLALHGDVDNDRPENSKLYFTKSKDTLEDNLLYSHELFALDIPAELTVLSACNTGTGKIATGEGIMSLGTAFQYAGTKSLLLNSWEVDDQTAPTLMKYFYTNLKEGMNKAQALQKAKLQYINTTSISRTDPFYWGGFYLVGDSSPIEFDNSNYLYWILGFSILAMILLSLFWYRRKSIK